MPERKIRVPLPNGQIAEGVEVPVEQSSERWSEFTLEDETVLRVKAVVASVIRIDGQYDQEGNPLYVVKSTPAMAIVSVPEGLRRKVN